MPEPDRSGNFFSRNDETMQTQYLGRSNQFTGDYGAYAIKKQRITMESSGHGIFMATPLRSEPI